MKKTIIVFLSTVLIASGCSDKIVENSITDTQINVQTAEQSVTELPKREIGDFFAVEYEENLVTEECARGIVSYLYAIQERDAGSFSAFYHPVQKKYIEKNLEEADCTMQDYVDYYYSKIAQRAGHEFRFTKCRLTKTSDDKDTSEYADKYLMELLDNINVFSKEHYGTSVRFKDAYVLGCDGYVEADGKNASVMEGMFLVVMEDKEGYHFALRE